MKILVTGAKGQLGKELLRQADQSGLEVIPMDRLGLDITDRDQVEQKILISRPSLVINAAAYTNVDRAEAEERLAFLVNRHGPANLAASCAGANIPLVHISTDFVFDGKKGTPYTEADPTFPLGVYGRSKSAGEDEIRSCLKEHIIVRTAWLYSVYGHNFVKTMVRLGKERNVISVVADQHGSPTCAADLAEALLTIACRVREGSEISWGTYHYCGHGVTTWHGFADAIFELAGQYPSRKVAKVESITTAEYPTPAKRPAFSALDCSLIQKNFGIKAKPWKDSLKNEMDRILSDG